MFSLDILIESRLKGLSLLFFFVFSIDNDSDLFSSGFFFLKQNDEKRKKNGKMSRTNAFYSDAFVFFLG
jgi:hypothetical protein